MAYCIFDPASHFGWRACLVSVCTNSYRNICISGALFHRLYSNRCVHGCLRITHLRCKVRRDRQRLLRLETLTFALLMFRVRATEIFSTCLLAQTWAIEPSFVLIIPSFDKGARPSASLLISVVDLICPAVLVSPRYLMVPLLTQRLRRLKHARAVMSLPIGWEKN